MTIVLSMTPRQIRIQVDLPISLRKTSWIVSPAPASPCWRSRWSSPSLPMVRRRAGRGDRSRKVLRRTNRLGGRGRDPRSRGRRSRRCRRRGCGRERRRALSTISTVTLPRSILSPTSAACGDCSARILATAGSTMSRPPGLAPMTVFTLSASKWSGCWCVRRIPSRSVRPCQVSEKVPGSMRMREDGDSTRRQACPRRVTIIRGLWLISPKVARGGPACGIGSARVGDDGRAGSLVGGDDDWMVEPAECDQIVGGRWFRLLTR